MKRYVSLICVVFLLTSFYPLVPQKVTEKDLSSVCLSAEEVELYNLVNVYRKQYGLPAIPLSRSLTYVAQQHSKDLTNNNPDRDNRCNLHSWSSKGDWTPCCYTRDHAQAKCMWNKPSEMTNYKGTGYEISAWSSFGSKGHITPSSALEIWKKSKPHNEVILNKGIWKRHGWKSIGIGIYKGYANIWFGDQHDVEEKPSVCSK